MNFAEPQMFWLLLILLAPLCAFLIWTWRTKQKLIAAFVQSRLLANLTVGVSQARQKLRLVLIVSAVLFLIVAMARPQWGFSLEEARHQGLDIVVAIDTSRSMLAMDLAPDRLTRAKLAALDLMRLAKSDRLGIVAFAGSAFLQTPLTLDEEAFRQNIAALDVGIIPQGGTAITEAIESALTAFEQGTENHKVLVLFTDGEDHDDGAIEAAEKAAKKGLRIFTIGVGTAEGEMLRVPDEQGNLVFLKDHAGNAVKSRLDETLLQKLATAANGFYLPLRGAKPMEALYAQGLAPLPKSDSTTKLVRQARERFHWPLAIAIIVLVLEAFLPQRKRPKPMATESALRMETLSVTVVLLLISGTGLASASTSSALRQYEAGNFHTALEEFTKLSRQKTNDLRLSFNAGAAAYKAKQLEEAQKYFGAATAAPDLQLQQQAYYNLGNTLFEMGEQVQAPDKKQKAWENSVNNFENSLKLNPQDADAKHNLEVVKQMLEELKKQQQEQQQQESKDDQSGDENKEKQENKDQSKNQDQEKQDKENKQSEEKDSENKEEQAKNDKGEQGKPEEKEDSQNKKEQPQADGSEEPGEEQDGEPMPAGQMTQEQARQFLDSQKQEDRALIFQPKEVKTRPTLKDW